MVFKENSPHCRCFDRNESINLRNLNFIIIETKRSSDWRLLDKIPHSAGVSCYEFLHSEESKTLCGSKTDTIKILSCLYHDLDDFEMKVKSFNLSHFVCFIIYAILKILLM